MKKDDIRRINKTKRNSLQKCDVEIKSRKACECFLNSDIYKKSQTIMIYAPLGNETDTKMIFDDILKEGKTAVFPVTDGNSGIITPIAAGQDTEFIKGAFSVWEPTDGFCIDISEIDAVIVPGIAFDKKGARVGFGKGCYDRFLNKVNAVKLGFCFAFQIADSIEADCFDIKMDFLVCESGLIVCE